MLFSQFACFCKVNVQIVHLQIDMSNELFDCRLDFIFFVLCYICKACLINVFVSKNAKTFDVG